MSSGSLQRFFDSLSRLRALVVGDAMLDRYIWGRVGGISPEAPVPIVRVQKKDYRLGGAANVALNLRALGATPVLCATVGEDKEGHLLLKRMKINSLSQEGIWMSPDHLTTIKTRIIADQRHVVRVDEESDGHDHSAETRQLLYRIEKLMPSCHVVIFEDYDKGVITSELIAKTVEMAKKNRVPVIVDPKKKNFMSYRGVTLMTPNLKELANGLGVEIMPGDQKCIKEAVEQLKKCLQTNVLLTLSADGVYMDYGAEKISVPAHQRAIADVSGAGDTVSCIAALCMALNMSPKFTAALANLGGGLVCQYVGVAPIDLEELRREAFRRLADV